MEYCLPQQLLLALSKPYAIVRHLICLDDETGGFGTLGKDPIECVLKSRGNIGCFCGIGITSSERSRSVDRLCETSAAIALERQATVTENELVRTCRQACFRFRTRFAHGCPKYLSDARRDFARMRSNHTFARWHFIPMRSCSFSRNEQSSSRPLPATTIRSQVLPASWQ